MRDRTFLLPVLVFVLVLMSTWAAALSDVVITGTVTDETGAPLGGASVGIVDNPLGSITDDEGLYRFAVGRDLLGKEVTLKASYVGHSAQTAALVPKAGTNKTDFVLGIDVLYMEEIVVTALGVGRSRERLGVTINKVAPKVIVDSDEADVVTALSGKVPNVEITKTSGEPGAASYIRIRGVNSIMGGTQPLFVVDGSPINNQSIHEANTSLGDAVAGVTQQNRAADINPEDIESVEILKGGAAAAMYGSRAANGVVLITTKQGQPGRPRVSYKMSYSFDEVNESAALQRSYGQGIDGSAIEGFALTWGPRLDTLDVPTYDHAWEMFETGNRVENNLTVSGGNDMTTYFVSVGRTDHDGAIKGNSNYLRDAVRLKASQRINGRLSVTGNAAFSSTSSNRIQKGSNVGGLLLGAYRTPPDFNNRPYLDPETGFHRSYRNPNPESLAGSRGYDNPFFIVNEHTNISDVGRFFGNLNLDYNPLNWLNVRYTLGYDYANDERRTVLPLGNSDSPQGKIIRDKYTTTEADANLAITATRAFAPADMRVDLMVGQNLNQREYNEFSTTGNGISVDGFEQLSNTSSYTPQEYEEIIRTEGYFAQALVDVWDQLYLTVGVRNDGSSIFSEGRKRHWYPKFSTAWDFTNLHALQNQNLIAFGKLRAAYGVTGREPNAYSTITAFETDIFEQGWGVVHNSTAFGQGGFFTDDTKGQEKIKPERARELELGTDLGLLGNRLGFDLTYYDQKTEDVIFPLSLPPSTGFFEQIKNAGTITNKGVELGIYGQPVSTKDIKWSVNAVYARNRNEVTDLPGAEFVNLGGLVSATGNAIEGEPVGVFRGEDFIRFGRGIKIDEEVDGETQNVNIDERYTGWNSGDLYIAADGYPLLDPEIRIIGDPNPDWTGSIRNTVTLFNNLEVSGLFDIRSGGEVWNGTRGALYFFGTHKDTEDRDGTQVFEGQGPGAGTEVAKGQAWHLENLGSGLSGPASQFVEDGGYIKLREIAVAYDFRGDFVQQLGLTNLNLRLSARNLATWTDYRGIDPETNLTGASNLRGLDYFNNPNTRSYVMTLRLDY